MRRLYLYCARLSVMILLGLCFDTRLTPKSIAYSAEEQSRSNILIDGEIDRVFHEQPTAATQLAGLPSPVQTAAATPTLVAAISIEQQLTALQQQVKALQSQVAALMSVLKVTATSATLQAPTITIVGNDGVAIQSQKSLSFVAGQNLNMQAGANTAIKGGVTTAIEGTAVLDLKGTTIKLNGGAKPLATVGSQVLVPGQAAGQVTTGSTTVFGN